MKSREGRWAAAEGNETEAPGAAGDYQAGFACPGCAVAGIKELAGQPAPQSWLGQSRGGQLPGPGFTAPAKQGPRRSRAALLEALFAHESVRIVGSGERESEREVERPIEGRAQLM